MSTIKIILDKGLLIVFLLPCFVLGQTVNTGEFYVTPGTQFSTISAFDNKNQAIFINDGETFIYNNFHNDGVVDFTINESIIHFEGNLIQQLTGTSISYFYDIDFDNASSTTASFELSSEISVSGEANFEIGIINNGDFGGLVTFENNASHTGVFDGSYVDGPVQKVGDENFTYPIGDSQFFRKASISAPNVGTDLFTARYYFENPVGQTINGETPTSTISGNITEIDTTEFWIITKDVGQSDILLTLSYDESTTLESIYAEPQTAIHILRWDEDEQSWIDEGGIVNTLNKTVTTPASLDGYGIFTLGRVEDNSLLEDIDIYNYVSSNGDGVNDYFHIDGIQDKPNNVQIFNRWGVKVFETNNYDTVGNVFDGYSDARLTVSGDRRLPTGTYYYILKYEDTQNGVPKRIKKAGYLYLTAE